MLLCSCLDYQVGVSCMKEVVINQSCTISLCTKNPPNFPIIIPRFPISYILSKNCASISATDDNNNKQSVEIAECRVYKSSQIRD